MFDLRLQRKVLFVSTMAGTPWGGSEELWSQTALRLSEQGISVAASVHGWPQPDKRLLDLSKHGIVVKPRPKRTLFSDARRSLSAKPQIVLDVGKAFGDFSPDLVVISDGSPLPPIELVELCIEKRWPFAAIMHTNFEGFWPTDELGARYRKAFPLARRCFFVSKANQVLEEKLLGYDLDNAEVVWNPITIDLEALIPWPSPANGVLRLACVGRLQPLQKGQDILLEALALRRWADRQWRLTLYGEGPQRDALERLTRKLNLSDRVVFAGHCPIVQVWRENHALVLPSRYEGLPLTIIEAMLCGRPVLATDVAGNPEVIEDGVTGFLAEAPVVACVDRALERVWAARDGLEEMGKAAAASVRRLLPKDPVGIFAEKLKSLMN
jgi:glycosyltransferase involved in cell wall biosynthesis